MIYQENEYDDLFPAVDSLHPTAPIVNKQPYEQIFTAPGTWTWPGNVEYVDVLVVGGGGGGAGSVPFNNQGGAGGGGVRREFVAVSAPVSVTIGAGGTKGTPAPPIGSGSGGNVGGSTSFGPFTVGGGGGASGPGASGPVEAPADGGGAGSSNYTVPSGAAGAYGSISWGQVGGGALDSGGWSQTSTSPSTPSYIGSSFEGSKGKYGFGGGGVRWEFPMGPGVYPAFGAKDGGGEPGTNAVANRGGGGGGSPYGVGGGGGNGGSGICIVRWWE